MTWQIVAYSMAVSAALGVVGLCCEWLATLRAWPRRLVWAIAIVTSMAGPAAAVLLAEPRAALQMPVVHAQPAGTQAPRQPAWAATDLPQGADVAAQVHPEAGRPQAMDIDGLAPRNQPRNQDSARPVPAVQLVPVATAVQPRWLPPLSAAAMLGAWGLVTAALWLHLLMAAVLLRRRAAAWRRECVLDQQVLVSPDTGPALFGFWQPRIVVPRWFLELPAAEQALILAHERQHLLARDPLLLLAAQLAVAAMPWNLPLWWQLRRLRLAMELDCDARVLRGGAVAAHYGRILLGVAQRAGAAPFGAVAMSRPRSVLEYRIRHLAPRPVRSAALQTGGAMSLAAAGMAVALALEAPALPARPSAGSTPAAASMAIPIDVAAGIAPAMQQATGVVVPAGSTTMAASAEPVITGTPLQSGAAQPASQSAANAGATRSSASRSDNPGLVDPLPPAPLDLDDAAAVADRAVAALVAAHPQLVDGSPRGGWYSGAVVLRTDGSVLRTALRHADDRSQAIRDILDLRYIPTSVHAGPAVRVPGAQAPRIPMEARRPGEALPDGRTLRDNLVFQYAVLPPGTDENRTLLAVWAAVLARHGALLLPRDAAFANRVTVLLTDDGRIARERVEVGPRAQMLGGTPDFGALGIRAEDIGVWGTTTVTRNDYSDADAAPVEQQVMRAALASALRVQDELVVHYAWPRRAGEPADSQPDRAAPDGAR